MVATVYREADARLIAAAPDMLLLLQKALPIIEAEAARRDLAGEENSTDNYWTEMRNLADEITTEIAKAGGEAQ
ncbi:MAG: hypothetical protein ACREA2_11710 [Blastocatellia bacterium]